MELSKTVLFGFSRVIAIMLLSPYWLRAEDCNQNGVDDVLDLAPGTMAFASPEGVEVHSVGTPNGVSVRVADLNGDAYSDVVAVPHTYCPRGCSSSWSVFLSLADGSLDLAGVQSIEGELTSVEPADLDGDGDTDLVAYQGRELMFFMNDGVGNFQYGGGVLFPDGCGLAFGLGQSLKDVDRDGKVDILTSCSLLRNEGGLSFLAVVDLPEGGYKAVDWDGDGRTDLVRVTPPSHVLRWCLPGSVSVLHNRGNGTFDPAVTHEFHWCWNSWWFGESPLDIDSDGDADLVAYVSCSECERQNLSVVVFQNAGGDLLEAGTVYNAPDGFIEPGDQPWSGEFLSAAADLTGDGKVDFAAVAGSNGTLRAWVLRNNGDGTFESSMSTRPGVIPWSLVAMDLNRDGRADLAVANGEYDGHDGVGLVYSGTSDITVLLSSDDGSFASANTYFVGAGPFNIEAADFDRDGSPDLVVGTSSAFSLFRNAGDGTFLPGETPRLDFGSDPSFLATGDLDGDGLRDIVAVTAEGISVLMNQGARSFLLSQPFSHPTPYLYGPIALGDLNGDGHLDLLSSLLWMQPSSFVVHIGRGDGTFEESYSEPLPDGLVSAGYPTLADLDWDGIANLAVSDIAAGAVWVDGVKYPVQGAGALAAVDLDRDGDIDLAASGGAVLLNRGDGTFENGAGFEGEGSALVPLLADDLDGDGWADLAIGSGKLLRNRGDGTFETTAFHFPPSSSLATLDYDGDGREDLILAAPGGAAVLLNQTLPASSRDPNHNGIPDECEPPPRPLFHRGDTNADGATDISDAIAILGFLFLGGEELPCRESADTQNDGGVDISDAVALLSFLFLGGPPPAAPGPARAPCGLDPDEPGSAGDLGCSQYTHC